MVSARVEDKVSSIGDISSKKAILTRPEFAYQEFDSAFRYICKAVKKHMERAHDVAIPVCSPPAVVAALADVARHDSPHDVLRKFIDLYIATAPKVSARGYMARQFSSVLPVSAAIDALTAQVPQPASFFEVGPLPNAADHLIQREFEGLLGWTPGEGRMISTMGGSLANLTAILAARNAYFSGSWQKGIASGERRPAVAMGADAHYSLPRAVGILGIGTDQIIPLPLDERRRICPAAARLALDKAAADGYDVFCIVASAGTTTAGAIDPMAELSALARARNIWLHVDGAHAGAFLVSDELRPRLAGLELADSFCLDAHKTLFVPAMCTLLFYRNRHAAEGAFAQEASYVFSDPMSEISSIESGGVNFECTKRPGILNLWLAWAMYGRGVFESKLNHLVALTGLAHDIISDQNDFEAMHEPQSNILCFRHIPAAVPEGRVDEFQLDLHAWLIRDGRFFISKSDFDGLPVLRLVFMNHEIEGADILALLQEIRRAGQEILLSRASPSTNAA